MTEETIFAAALEKADPAERAAYLNIACAGDDALHRRVEALLASHGNASFLGAPALPRSDPKPANAAPTASWAGARAEAGTVLAGRYKLLELIGEGGMGAVWMAEQTEPVKRRVALKLIKPGMDSKQVVARFEAERQALALMDHPNIAKVLDGSVTKEDRPYFVMELVKGVPLTAYCDDKRLGVRERLALFADVCRAVQHAHQKGVIHRDLKPSNVLVAPYDGKPVVKVIDFGVAKAAGPQLTEKTLFTGFGAVVGTLEYMSPEQAELNNADIDTRSDIYSLGVLLYELLTGSTPLTRQRVREAALLEVLRLVREEEPPRPSTRLSTADGLATVAAVRGEEPGRLTKLVRGELDWIVMRALEKDRNRRYETANGLAAEIDRYLAGEPVHAVPASAGYRFRKFVRRNRGRLVVAGVLGIALLVAAGGVVGSTAWVLADRSIRRQGAALVAREALASSAQHTKARNWPLALAEARRAETALRSIAGVEQLQHETNERVRDLELVSRLERVRLQKNDWRAGLRSPAEIDDAFASAFRERGLDLDGLNPGALGERIRALPVAVELALALDDWTILRHRTAKTLQKDWQRLQTIARVADPDEARLHLRSMIGRELTQKDRNELTQAVEQELAGRSPPQSLVHLAVMLNDADEWDLGVRVLRHALQLYPDDFWANIELGLRYAHKGGRETEAVRYLSTAHALQPDVLATRVNLGILLLQTGHVEEAIAQQKAVLGADPHDAHALVNLGHALAAQHDLAGAIASHRRAIELNPDAAVAHNSLGVDLKQQGDLDGAMAELDRAIQLNPLYAWAYSNKASVLLAKERWDEAIVAARKAIELKDAMGAPFHNLGKALYKKRDFKGAAEANRKALELSPDLANASDDLGLALAMQDDLPGAVAAFQQAIKVNPKHVGAMTNLGFALLKLDRYDEAIASLRHALEVQPGYKPAENNLASALNLRARELVTPELVKPGYVQRAVAMSREVVKLDSDFGPHWHTLGMAEFRARNWKAAAEAMQEAMKRRMGGNAYEWLFLAMVHHELGERDEARRWFGKSVEWMTQLKTPDPYLEQFRREAEARLKPDQK
jgi:tetratricopeptide (TPR) repeat protein/tRNA A-37 threonylcarbamoyl transferase component Bud32